MSIRTRYIAALLLTASLVSLSFTVIYNLISAQKQDAEIINIAGQQRMLSQRIALLASTGRICGSYKEKQYLSNALATFNNNHQRLISIPSLSPVIHNVYFGEKALDTRVEQYTQWAQGLFSAPTCDIPQLYSIEKVTQLLSDLDYVVDLFEREASARVDTVASVEVYLWLGTLLLLLIEAIFIFSPLDKAVRDSIKNLTTLKNQAEIAEQEARRASKAKSEFLSSMSHELRTPMNGLFGMIELALDNPEKSNVYLKKAQSAGGQLLILINDILDISKIEAGKIKVEHAPVDLLQVLDDAVSLQRAYCQKKGLAFHYYKDPSLPPVISGDITRITQILHNLLSNAIKFTDSGSVTLKVSFLEQTNHNIISFDVIDTGIGIDETKLCTIFDKFEQADQSTTRIHGGTGLGLSIAKQLAQLMEGDITVRSTPGKGSTFTFTMLAKSATLPQLSVDTQAPLHCAIIDDLQTSREYIEHIVSAMGIRSKSYHCARAFLDDDPLAYDILIVDLAMPTMSGIDMLLELESLEPITFPRVILISAELERLTYEKDASHLLWRTHTKPINRRELEHDLSSLFEKSTSSIEKETSVNQTKRILIAEDNDINAEIVKAILNGENYRFLHVKDGQEAVNACKRYSFNLILMDCNMPIMGGIEASKILRSELKITTPIVALTANAFAEDKEECLAAGMDDFLPKPIDKTTLLTCIRKHVHHQ
ncbi:MAG: two-component system sensor histidine kinase [Alteromonas sp. Nap_26]|nr:MAG: two-component system sensor histidine kinase [Alteromonas sp. Nap_26]